MTNVSQNFEGNRQHPPQEDFLLYVDGELSPKETERWESHLGACWSCRAQVAKIEETITEIVAFKNTISQFQFTRTSSNWGNFDSRLNDITMELGHPSITTRFTDLWKQIGHLRAIALPVRIAVPTLTALLIVAIVYQFVITPTVSAAELLKLSIEAHAQKQSEIAQPVLHQRLSIKRSNQTPVTLEIWNDTVNSRVKISSPPYARSDAASANGVGLSDLQSILRANRMNEYRPLSAASYQAWTDSLTRKTENVVKENDTLTIQTISHDPIENSRITEARFAIRESDYHPTSLYIRTSEELFELTEQDCEIVNLKDVDPSVFSEGTVVTAIPEGHATAKTGPSVSPADPADGLAANTNAALAQPNMPAATTADEIEVLDRLHQIGADVTEQINVTRAADGRLLVEGLVETDKRKQEVLTALAPVRNNPAIRVNIQTIEEATKALQRQKAQATPGMIERVEVERAPLAVDAELRAFFEQRGGDANEHIRAFASRVISRAKSAAFQASALNRMANRFNAEQLRDLDPAVRAKYIGILRGYASAVRRETAALRGVLQPVFGDVSDGGSESVTSDADLIASARRLYELASQNDSVIHSAFTISSGGMSVSAVKSAQFRRSLGQAEVLAAAIERAR